MTKLLGPQLLQPIFQERIWGEFTLEPWFPKTHLETPIGEAWLTSLECTIVAGTLQGQTLQQAMPEFPLLLKILFPREKLSVQVHPNDAQAAAANLPFGRGKTECWYVLSAEPDATVAVGFKDPLSLDQVRASIADNTMEDKLYQLPVTAGDMVFVEAGTVHAIGPGVVILETQQYSDVTYRMFDYGRPRQLHLDQGLAVTRVTTGAKVTPPKHHGTHTELVHSAYFVVDRFSGAADLNYATSLQLVIALTEASHLHWPGGSMPLPKAHAVILPAEDISYRLTGSGDVIRVRQ